MDSELVLAHQPCADCGSSDALSIYSDGHTYCFSCEQVREGEEVDISEAQSANNSTDLYPVSYSAFGKRGITEETAKFWSYGRTPRDGRMVHVAQYLDDNRKVVAQKLRLPDKTFPWKNRKAFKGLYGQWLWPKSGREIVITEGEIDALTVSQARNLKWPVVSLPDGAGSAVKAIKESLDWLQKYDKIILFFDNDEAGREAVDKVKRLLPAGKCYIAFTPEGYKDPNDLLKAGKSHLIQKCLWDAKLYRPDGIVSGNDVIERLTNRVKRVSYPYPEFMERLNWMTAGGARLSELVVWTSGTGMGKTTVIKALQHHFFKTTNFNQALIHLEEPLEDTGDDLIAYHIGRRFTVEADGEDFRDTAEYLEAAKELFAAKDTEGNFRFQLYDAFGSLEDDSLYDIIRYLAVAQGCKFIWLDHLSILVSEEAGEDERKRIDSIMHKLKALTIELDIHIELISHLRKPTGNGKPFEEGGVPSLDDLRGSGGIKQLSNAVFALSRNQQAENGLVRNTSTITVLKSRKTGRTGTADFITFSDETGRIEKGVDPASLDDFDQSEAPTVSDY
ncbi:DnaB-like helicase C-terminal domain-containing protein [Maritalea mediterranea]|uniref:Toprim domain-containing protein n=1 Tax=Maritalea mediterranea TaxID=2909667 RepID=A0ABS9ECB6_9HYPH|nr:DnaB-like helicase C-terminal domain-containing protein [Maritalea mediterranea]MCF4099804.1 toprim domain-containing protein [Maritalea mediterranea]